MSYIPDMTERFPEGMRGVDLTDTFFPPSGLMEDYDCPSMEEQLEEQERMRQQELQEEIEEAMEELKVNEKTAKEIVTARRKAKEEIQRINFRLEDEVDEILEANGYEAINDIPF